VEVVKVVSDAYRELGLIAIRCSDDSVSPASLLDRCPGLAEKLRAELEVEEIALVAWHPDIKEYIRNAFAPIEVKQVSIQYDPLFEQEVAKVVISEDDFEEANTRMRTAAMLTQQDLEFVLEDDS
jgi:transcription antitermination factor NusA-like protein